MKDLSEVKRNYQAEVHFALGAVIQVVWYVAPGVDGVLFRSLVLGLLVVGLVLFIVYSVRRFQRHLEVNVSA